MLYQGVRVSERFSRVCALPLSCILLSGCFLSVTYISSSAEGRDPAFCLKCFLSVRLEFMKQMREQSNHVDLRITRPSDYDCHYM